MTRSRDFGLCVTLLALLGIVLAIPGPSIASRLGLYTDESGSSCSFSGNDPGIVNAYLVVRADADGVLGMRFSAPVPPCMGATYLYDTPVPGVVVIGQSSTGISVVFPTCAILGAPAVALEISYLRTGSTTACCDFPVVADPFVGSLEVTDCSYVTHTGIGVTSHFNADETCPCAPEPPHPPINPSPADLATGVDALTVLSWEPSPLDPDVGSYDVYLGTNSDPAYAGTVMLPTFNPGKPLNSDAQYYWRVVTHDPEGLAASGPVWSFHTEPNAAPDSPTAVYPVDGSIGVPPDTTLAWNATDPDSDPLTYDLYFGTATSPPFYAGGLVSAQYQLPTMEYDTTYRWKIVAHDPLGHTTTGVVWSFTTMPQPPNHPPIAPSNPDPANYATGVGYSVTLSWTASDPDNDPLKYSVYFGTSSIPPLVAGNRTSNSYDVTGLMSNTRYYWRVIAIDDYPAQTSGPLWTFVTRSNVLPSMTSWSPARFATGIPVDVTLTWEATDPDDATLTYDLYFGAVPFLENPPLIASNLTEAHYSPGPLDMGTGYYWKVVPRDSQGAGTPTPYLGFTTISNATGVSDVPAVLTLGRNHPNPFNPQTIIPYGVPAGNTHVRVTIHDTSGRVVRVLVDENQSGGTRDVVWNGNDDRGTRVASGVYYCVLQAGNERRTQKLLLLK
ncbi:MAG TPA: FlgD immunoglobulin-like domain containing protein [Candidatus Krumholzibacteria bacterium]|nr:FlgD immunoglobulin-like domain containing protein [Candidatus Krumholzibacteria bacterium]